MSLFYFQIYGNNIIKCYAPVWIISISFPFASLHFTDLLFNNPSLHNAEAATRGVI